MELDEIARRLLEAGFEGSAFCISLWLTYYFIKKFIKEEVIEKIAHAVKTSRSAMEACERTEEKITGTSFKLMEKMSSLEDRVGRQVGEITRAFAEMSQHSIESHIISQKTSDELKSHQRITDEKFVRTAKVFKATHDKTMKLESVVQKLSDDLIILKNKKKEE